jgi:tRNA U34 2-thiouridine synthase MnmA/TrmU
MSKVYVGMSGGVDSSLTAALLKEAGHDVTGVYMKNWTQDLPGMRCPWADDLADAKRVAVQLGIDFKVFDFEAEYKQKVVDYMIEEYQAGRTPNPDIMCNQEIKFKLFLETALEDGADLVATGHYARTENGRLLMAQDDNKDQTYFLYRVSEEALKKTLFEVYVSTNLNDGSLWLKEIKLSNVHWINQTSKDGTYNVRVRHRAPLVLCELRGDTLVFTEPQRAVTAGQSAVLYDGDVCLGGGIVVQ